MGGARNLFDSLGADESRKEIYGNHGRKACRVCDDFKSWRKKKSTQESSQHENSESHQCPVDREELGRSTWSFLHTMAAYFPEKPTVEEKTDMTHFVDLFAKFYPCSDCAVDFQKTVKESRPDVTNNSTFSRWMCEQHNLVNVKLGKPKFDCSKVLERWRDGWKDGSCD